MIMKRYVCLFLFLLTVLGLRAQVAEAMECWMMKATAQLITKDNEILEDADPPMMVHFTLCYGAKSSGYTSDDYIYLLGDDSDAWERYGCMSFMDMPADVKKVADTIGDRTVITNIFYGNGFHIGLFVLEPPKGAAAKSDCQMIISNGGDKSVAYRVFECDFYDISGGQERLVLEKYHPFLEDYNSTDNLFRVFMDRMYEYYR